MRMTAFERNAIVRGDRQDVEALLVKIRHGFATYSFSDIRFTPKVKYVSEKGSVTCVIQVGSQVELWISKSVPYLSIRVEKCGKVMGRHVRCIADVVELIMDEYTPRGKRRSPITEWTTNEMRKVIDAGMLTRRAMIQLSTQHTNKRLREIERARSQCHARIEQASSSSKVSK